jgi:hypothetical protein
VAKAVKRLIFYNTWNFGDLHSNKEWVRQIMEEMQLRTDIKCIYKTNRGSKPINLPIRWGPIDPWLSTNIPSYYDDQQKELRINTWIGHFPQDGHSFFSQIEMWRYLFHLVQDYTGIKLEQRSVEDYISKIDTDLITIPKLSDNPNKVIFCNNKPSSYHTRIGSHEKTINKLAGLYPQIEFISCENFKTNHKNILFTDQINNRTGPGQDLPEIGHISEQCKLIVTNSSGPGTFAMTRNNFMNPNQTIMAYTLSPSYTFWNGLQGLQSKNLWSSLEDNNEVYKEINKEIKRIFEGVI